MIPAERLQEIIDRFGFVEAKISETTNPGEIAALGREYAGLRGVVATIRDWQAAQTGLEEARELLDDPEMAGLATAEIAEIEAGLPGLEEALRLALLPRDAADARPAIIEIRPGTGGDEAALFAGDLFRMYQRFAEAQGWRVEIISENPAELGGYREIVVAIRGEGVFARMKFESGVHRVQRVPETESQGRIHTSAATVAVLPEAEEIDIEIAAATSASTPCAPAAPAASTSTPPIRRCGSPTCRPASSCSRPKNRSTRTAPSPWRCCARGCSTGRGARPTRRAPPSARARSAPATGRSASGPTIFRKAG